MQLNKKERLINKILKKKKEYPLLELKITDYNNSNFYLSLVYNRTIEKFKVLYIPLDVVEESKIEEYFCYQFMEVKSVMYIIDQIKRELPKYPDKDSRDSRNKNIRQYEIELDIHLDNKVYDFYTTRYLPRNWKFLFEAVVMLFEHSPNVMNGLATEVLSVIMNTNEIIEYQASINCDLWNADLTKYFPSLRNEKEYKEGKIQFLEYVNGKYFAVIEKHLLVIEYNDHQKLLNIYCDKKDLVYSNYTYQVLNAIQNHQEKKFYKIKIVGKQDIYNYLCLGVEKEKLKIIKKNKLKTLSLHKLKKEDIMILEDFNHELEEKIEEVLEG